jgi:maltokinase
VISEQQRDDGSGTTGLAERELVDALVAVLPDWLGDQRWFGGKGRTLHGVRPVQATVLQDGEPELLHLVLAVAHDGGEELYQLLVGLRRVLPEYLEHGRVADVDGRIAYDATNDPDLNGRLLELIRADAETEGLRFRAEPGVELTTGLPSRPVGAEQSNTSVVFGQQYILKLFRKLAPGVSPDLELHRALKGVGCSHIAAPLGSIEGELDGATVTYGMLQEFVPNAAEGWQMATASVRDLMAEADLHADEVGGDFSAEACRLGEAVAEVHADLARALGTETIAAADVARAAEGMKRRLTAVAADVPELAPHVPAIRAVFDRLAAHPADVRVQRIHGDLHLGQVLRTVTGWVLIDFEGEPATELSRRIERMSPLRDVAGMLRSFDYAGFHLLAGQEPDPQLEYRAAEWAARNRSAFCDGYSHTGPDPRDAPLLLHALELDKAVYEVAYEARNRPSWLPIPLASIARIAASAAEAPVPDAKESQ